MYVKTERLELKPVSEADRAQMHALLTDDQIKKTYMLPDFENEAQVERLFQRLMELSNRDDHYVVGIILNGELIGFLNDVEITGDTIELGYVVSTEYWGKGYATEALRGMTGELFRRGFTEVITGAFETNTASVRVMEKCGMTRMEKTDEIQYRGKVHTCVYYAIRKLKLVKPGHADMKFKQDMLADESTMSYNHAFGGTITFPEEKWGAWYQKWIGSNDPNFFYRYLFFEELQTFVGEAAYHYETGRYLCDVIVMAKYRGQGFGKLGLQLLCEAAKENGIAVLYDDILLDNPSVQMFLKAGFREVSRDEKTVAVKKEL